MILLSWIAVLVESTASARQSHLTGASRVLRYFSNRDFAVIAIRFQLAAASHELRRHPTSERISMPPADRCGLKVGKGWVESVHLVRVGLIWWKRLKKVVKIILQ